MKRLVVSITEVYIINTLLSVKFKYLKIIGIHFYIIYSNMGFGLYVK